MKIMDVSFIMNLQKRSLLMIGQHISQRRLILLLKRIKLLTFRLYRGKSSFYFSDRILSEICPFKYLFNRYFDGVI